MNTNIQNNIKENSVKDQPKIRRKRGRPSLFRDYMVDQAEEMGALGLTNDKIGRIWGVTIRSLERWSKKHPEFCLALKAGKEKADSKVVQSLYTAAIEGNTTAMIFWLKNRDPVSWRDRTDPLIEQHTHYVKVYLPKGKKNADGNGREESIGVETSSGAAGGIS